jgi:hypothetical protein
MGEEVQVEAADGDACYQCGSGEKTTGDSSSRVYRFPKQNHKKLPQKCPSNQMILTWILDSFSSGERKHEKTTSISSKRLETQMSNPPNFLLFSVQIV